MVKILRTTTATIDVVIEETFTDEYQWMSDHDPEKAEVIIKEYKIENTKWKQLKEEAKDE